MKNFHVVFYVVVAYVCPVISRRSVKFEFMCGFVSACVFFVPDLK